jgi:hypothetical protein
VAIQALFVALAPSRAPDATDQFGAIGDRGPGDWTQDGNGGWDPDGGVDGQRTGTDPAAPRDGAPGAPGDDAGATADRGQEGDQRGAPTGDREHCSEDGRQFDLIYHAPPCVPRWEGSNPGATYQGVTEEEVVVVRYYGQANAAVNALLASQDLAAEDSEVRAFKEAAEEFINAHYELYGREIRFVEFQGSCTTVPPDYPCLRDDMRQIVAEHQPFWVTWNTTLASAAFDELSAHQTLNSGGWHFDDGFAAERAPFHWDVRMSGTQVARHLAEYWCKRLAGGNAQYAGDPIMQQQERRLGVITPDDPANMRVFQEFEEMVADCGSGVAASYHYAQDIDRANEQRNAGVDRMIDNDVTTIICICDGIAPYFLVITCDEKNYHPEHIVPATGGMDFDPVGRLYNASTQWDRAFGLSVLPDGMSYADNDAARVWRATGRSGQPYNTAFALWNYFNMVSSLIQMAGPELHPGTVHAAAFERLGVRGGWQESGGDPARQMFAFGLDERDYTWASDVREVYWCRRCTSTSRSSTSTGPMRAATRSSSVRTRTSTTCTAWPLRGPTSRVSAWSRPQS